MMENIMFFANSSRKGGKEHTPKFNLRFTILDLKK